MHNMGKRRLTKVGKFNDIGIDSELDWDRITHLFKLGIIAALMVLAGDMILGWGVTDETLNGMDKHRCALDVRRIAGHEPESEGLKI